MSEHLLLDADWMQGLCPGEETCDLALHCGLRLGELTGIFLADDRKGDLPDQIRRVGRTMAERPQLDAVWKAALAREALLLPPKHFSWREQLDDLLRDSHPFNVPGPSWQDLRSSRFAAGMFPIGTKQNLFPGVGQVWLRHATGSESPPLPASLADFARSPGRHVWSAPLPATIHGSSWQLAAELARRALATPPEKELVPRLAARWIASGGIGSDDCVEGVQMDNKLDLQPHCGSRRWLLPSLNRDPALSSAIHWVDTAAQAWRVVSAEGIVHSGDAAWPERVSVLHSFASEQRITIFLLALLLPGLERLVLWHTNDEAKSWHPARELQKMLPGIIPRLEVEDPRLVSGNIAEIQEQIRPVLDQDVTAASSGGGEVFFNITNGTLPLRYVILHLAATRPELRLIYGDLRAKDAPPGEAEFSLLTFPNGEPSVTRLRYFDKDLPGWNFGALHQKRVPEPFDTAFVKELRLRSSDG